MKIEELERLAALRLDEVERGELADDLDELRRSIDELRRVDVDGVEPLFAPSDITTVERDDEPGAPMSVDDVVAQAPEVSDEEVSVPLVMDSDDDVD